MNTQKNYTKKIFMNQITTVVMITHLEPDILECEVRRGLEDITMNKASGGNGIPVELFQILKDGVVKVLHTISRFVIAFLPRSKRLLILCLQSGDSQKQSV